MFDRNAMLLDFSTAGGSAGTAAAQTGAWLDLKGRADFEGLPIHVHLNGGTGTVTLTFEWSLDGATVDATQPSITTSAYSAVQTDVPLRIASARRGGGYFVRCRSTAPTTATQIRVGLSMGDATP